MAVRNPEWYDLNESRSWPVADQATLLDDNGLVLPNDVIVDISLKFPAELGESAFVSTVTFGPRIVTVTILGSAFGTPPIAAVTVIHPVDPYRHYQLEPLYPGVGGWIVFGKGVLERKSQSFVFSTPQQSVLMPHTARHYHPAPVTGISKLHTVPALTGIVKLSGGNDIEIVSESREIDGTVRKAVVIRLAHEGTTPSGVNLFELYAGPCSGRAETGNCGDPQPIEFINSVPPDCCGNINIVFHGCSDLFSIDGECGALVECGFGLKDACIRQDHLPDADGKLPNEYDDICAISISSSLSSSSSVIDPPDDLSSESIPGVDPGVGGGDIGGGGLPVGDDPEDGVFRIVLLPDTQYYAESIVDYDPPLIDIFTLQTEWIAEKQELLKIRFVGHLGDIVEHGNNGGDPVEWDRVDGAMAVLDSAGIPYHVVPGNHDADTIDDRSSFVRFLEYFGPARYASMPGYMGASPSGLSAYFILPMEGRNYMYMGLALECDGAELSWAQSILDSCTNIPTIVSTHKFIRPDNDLGNEQFGGNSGQQLWDDLIYDNEQIFLVVNGHADGSVRESQSDPVGWSVALNAAGKSVIMVHTDFQTWLWGGNGYLRLIKFDELNSTLRFDVYSPLRNRSNPAPDCEAIFSGYDFVYRLGPKELLDCVGVCQPYIEDFSDGFAQNFTPMMGEFVVADDLPITLDPFMEVDPAPDIPAEYGGKSLRQHFENDPDSKTWSEYTAIVCPRSNFACVDCNQAWEADVDFTLRFVGMATSLYQCGFLLNVRHLSEIEKSFCGVYVNLDFVNPETQTLDAVSFDSDSATFDQSIPAGSSEPFGPDEVIERATVVGNTPYSSPHVGYVLDNVLHVRAHIAPHPNGLSPPVAATITIRIYNDLPTLTADNDGVVDTVSTTPDGATEIVIQKPVGFDGYNILRSWRALCQEDDAITAGDIIACRDGWIDHTFTFDVENYDPNADIGFIANRSVLEVHRVEVREA